MSTRQLLIFYCTFSLLLSACLPAPTSEPTHAVNITPTKTTVPTDTHPVTPMPTITATALLPATAIPEHLTFPKIDRRPRPVSIDDWKPWAGQTLEVLPTYEANLEDMWQMDLRTQDLSRLDLKNSLDDLLNAFFDDRTVWPPEGQMPEGFDWNMIMELGKNPGLGLRNLHEQGITGKGIGIAIIDQPLIVTHQEYADRLQLYEEIDIHPESYSEMHGPAVASLAVGKTNGVAPEADLYYIATYNGRRAENGEFSYDFTSYARAIRRVLEINRQPPEGRKIRVISISAGWRSGWEGYEEIISAVQAARDAGLLVVDNAPQDPFYACWRDGLGRDPRSDPDDFASYDRSWFAQFWSHRQPEQSKPTGHVLIPLDSHTLASPFGDDAYWFSRRGGESWGPPILAGMYALAAQVDPYITPDRFWEVATTTGRTIQVSRSGQTSQLGPILDPVALIQALQ